MKTNDETILLISTTLGDAYISSNVHDFLLAQLSRFGLSSYKQKKLLVARKAIEKKIVQYFSENKKLTLPKFWIQGSNTMGTLVRDRLRTYDIDLGVYFFDKPDVSPQTLQKYVFEAVNGQTSVTPQHREKCIRVVYKGDFDIDLPIYYKLKADNHPYLATKNGWIESDPRELCKWFAEKIKENKQILRLVKYLKLWCRARKHKSPSGIALTVWIAQHYQHDERDDVAFYRTLTKISQTLEQSFTCINPATPGDDLTRKLDEEQKRRFANDLKGDLSAIRQALQETSFEAAQTHWINILQL